MPPAAVSADETKTLPKATCVAMSKLALRAVVHSFQAGTQVYCATLALAGATLTVLVTRAAKTVDAPFS